MRCGNVWLSVHYMADVVGQVVTGCELLIVGCRRGRWPLLSGPGFIAGNSSRGRSASRQAGSFTGCYYSWRYVVITRFNSWPSGL